MTRRTSTNFTGAAAFTIADAPSDIFQRGDVQMLGASTDVHNHTPGLGANIPVSALGMPLDIPGSLRSKGTQGFSDGIGLEVGYDNVTEGIGYIVARDAAGGGSTKTIRVTGLTLQVMAGQPASLQMTVQPNLVSVTRDLALGAGGALRWTGKSAVVYDYGADGGGNHLVGINALTVTPGPLYCASIQVNGGAVIAANLNVNGALGIAGGVSANQSVSIALDLTVARNVGVTGNITTGTFNSNGTIAAAGNINANGGTVFFEASNQVMIRWNGAQGRLEIPYGNGLWVSHLVAAGGVTALGGVVGTFLSAYGANGIFKVRPGRAEVTCYVYNPAGGGAAALAINTEDHHDQIFFVQGGAGGTGGWQQISARRYKDNITAVPAAEALALVQNPGLGVYRYTNRLLDDEPDVGLIAEDWVGALPEAVQLNDAGDIESMSYTSLVPILLLALRTTIARVEALERAA
jgi:hypothetical protein